MKKGWVKMLQILALKNCLILGNDTRDSIKMYISTMNNILGLNLIIINARVGALSISRFLSEGLRGTELSSLENVPDHQNRI